MRASIQRDLKVVQYSFFHEHTKLFHLAVMQSFHTRIDVKSTQVLALD